MKICTVCKQDILLKTLQAKSIDMKVNPPIVFGGARGGGKSLTNLSHLRVLKIRHQRNNTMTKYFAKVKTTSNSPTVVVEMNKEQYMESAINKVLAYVDDDTQEYKIGMMVSEDSYTNICAPNATHTCISVFNDRAKDSRRTEALPKRVAKLEAEVALLKRQKCDLEMRFGTVPISRPGFF